MRKHHFVLMLVILFFMINTVEAKVTLFFQPDNGFLRVEGEVTMDSSQPPLYFLLFPHAQITEFWIEGLRHYQLDRGPQGTLVNFSVENQGVAGKLQFAYEGFLELAGPEVTLNQDTLWFPQFSFSIKQPVISLEFPTNWHVNVQNQSIEEKGENTKIITWQSPAESYPTFTISQNEIQKLTDSTKVVEDVDSHLPQDELGELELITNGLVTEQQQNELVTEQQQIEEFLARIQIQVTRLINAINKRETTEIEPLLADQLKELGLPQYLASLPHGFGKLSSKFLSIPAYFGEPFQVMFTAETGEEFVATMIFEQGEDRPLLTSFYLTPFSPPFPTELLGYLETFVLNLRKAVQRGNYEQLGDYINIGDDSEQIQRFFYSLNPWVPWEIKYTALEPLSITVFVPHSETVQLLLNLGLVPGENNWLISTFDVFPLP